MRGTGRVGPRRPARSEFKHFAAFKDPARRAQIPDPNAKATFEASKPDLDGDDSFVRKLLHVRQSRIVPGIPGCTQRRASICWARQALVARWTLGTGETLSIAINLGDEKPALPQPEGDTVFEHPVGAWDAAMYGMMVERSAVAWIEPPR